jgi:hypothetical protein
LRWSSCSSCFPKKQIPLANYGANSRKDIDRFFETNPGIFIHNNKIATQLHRPAIYEEEDERIARGQGKEVLEKEEESMVVNEVEDGKTG